MTKVMGCATKLSSGELAVEAAMEAKLPSEDGNDDFALTIAHLVHQPRRGGRGEHGEASCEMETTMAQWSGR